MRSQRGAIALLGLFWALLVAKTVLLRAFVLEDPSVVHALVLEGPLLLGVLLVVDAFFADHRFASYAAVDFGLSALMLATAVYAAYYGGVPSRASLVGAGQAGTVTGSIASLVEPVHLLFVADVAVFSAIALVLYVRRRRLARIAGPADDNYVFLHRWAYAALIPALAVLASGVVGVRSMPQPVDAVTAASARGVLAYQLATLVPIKAQPVAEIDVASPGALQSRIDSLRGKVGPGREPGFESGQAASSNVIVIQVEALQSAALGARVGAAEVTPNLNRLARQSWYFPTCISQVGRGTTSDAEFISNTSLYPAPTGPSSLLYADRELPSLPRLLSKAGYDTMTFHTNSADYWNRSQLYAALGFDTYYDKAYFGSVDEIAFGASDAVLLSKALERLEEQRVSGRPFYAQVITMSSHHPFTAVPRERVPLKLDGAFRDTMTGRYLEEISYADAMLGEFLAKLEETGLAENTMVVIYGDHFGLPERPNDERDAAARSALFGDEYSVTERHSVPLIVRLPGQSSGRTVERPVGQIDIMPTITDALGIELDSTPHLGRSAFATASTIMPAGGFLAAGTYVDDRVLYVPRASFETGRAYDVLADGEPVELSRAQRVKWERMRQLQLLSDAYVRKLPQRSGYDPDVDYQLPE